MARARHSATTKAPPHGPHAPDTAAPRSVTGDTFYGWDGDTLVLNILGKPAAAKDAVGKPKGPQLKVSVTAAPREGKATDHMVRFLAPLFGVPVSRITVVFGRESIHKQLRIQAPTRLPAVIAEAGPHPEFIQMA